MRLPIDPATLRIPAVVAVLDNGLRVAVHRDRKSPLVAVQVVYRAGSREEPPGKYGLAHLFEHLMFCGSEHSRENFFLSMERIGATSINAHAADDYAAYFAAVPAAALDYALWMEAERMGCLGQALNRASLDRQRDIVRNELMQREGEPYGRAAALIRTMSYPPSHPYAHHPYGHLNDLENISLDDARAWHNSYYGPAGATLVIAGDVEPGDAIENARRRFAALDGESPATPNRTSVMQPSSVIRFVLEDQRAPSRVYRVWNVPGTGAPECAELEIACELIAGGNSSRLFKRLAEEKQLASAVAFELQRREMGSQIVLSVTAAPGTRIADLESALEAELVRFTHVVPSEVDCAAACARIALRFMRETEQVCGPRSKSHWSAEALLATGDPEAANAQFNRMARLDATQIRETAERWFNSTGAVIDPSPAPPSTARLRRIAHTGLPQIPTVSLFRWPKITQTTLDNGLRVIVVEHGAAGLVEMRLVLATGAVADAPAESGLAHLAMRTLARVRVGRDRRAIEDELARHGIIVRSSASLDGSTLEFSTLPDKLADVLIHLGDVVAKPEFDDSDLARSKAACAVEIRDETARPFVLATRLIPRLMFPSGHPYAQPFSGSGRDRAIAGLTVERVQDFHARALRTTGATLIVVGPTATHATIRMVERNLRGWKPSSEASESASERKPNGPRLARCALLDQPERTQAAIFAGLSLPAHRDSATDSLVIADTVVGGLFSSRLNVRLRETSGWSYGAYSRMLHGRHAGLWIAYSFVGYDRVAATIEEIRRALPNLGGIAIDEAEFSHARDYLIASAPARHETNAQLAAALQEKVMNHLPDGYAAGFSERLASLRFADFVRLCARQAQAASVVWLVIGDAARLTGELAGAEIGAFETVAAADL